MSSLFRVGIVLGITTMLSTGASAGFEQVYNAPPNSNSIDGKVISFIHAAVSTVDIAIYSIDHPGIVSEIIAAKNRGVAVRMVVETDNWNASCDQIVAAGITIVKDNAGGGGQALMHDKFIVRDGSAVLTGSYNFTMTQTTTDKNSIIIVTNASGLAGIYKQEFDQMFVYKRFGTAKNAITTTSTTVDGYPIEVYFSPKGGVMSKVIAAVGTCNSNLWFNIYTFTDQGLADAIKNRKAAGATVKGTFDRWQADAVYSKDEYLAAARCGVHRDTMPGLLHDKTMAIDAGTSSDPIGIIGSFNFTGSADSTNDENILIIHNSTVANSIKGNEVSIYNTRSN